MAKSTKGATGLGKALQGQKPKGGSSSKGKGKQQDIELGGETKPAAGARSSGRQSSVVTPEEIAGLLGQGGKAKKNVTDEDVKQVVFKWLKNESQSLEDLGKANGGKVLKWLQDQSDELYLDGLSKIKDPNNTEAITRQTQQAWKKHIGGQKPNESRPTVNGKTVKFRPEGRRNRKMEAKGNIDPNPTAVERLEKVGQRMDADAASDDDYLYALGQGYGPNNIDAELARIQTITDVNERQKAILALAQNTTQGMGRGDNATTIKVGQWLDQYLNKTAQPATPKGGGVKIGDGPLPTEKQKPLNFDGGGDAKTAGPAIPVEEPELKPLELTETKVDKTPKPPDGNQAADGTPAGRASNANQTQNTTEGPGQVPLQGAKRQPSEGGLGGNELPQLKDWARSHLLNAYINKTGRDPTVDPKAAREFEAGFQEAWRQIMEQPDPIATLKQMQAKNATTAQPTPEPTVNQAAAGTASSRANAAAGGSNVPPKNPSIPPGGATPKPGRGGLAPTGQTPSASKLNQNLKNAPKVNKTNTNRSGTIAGTALATGLVGSLAWKWLTGESSSEPDGPVSTPSASITGGPSTSTGSSSGSVADGSGGSSGGMSQEQMEYMMKLQQIRDEQKRRHVGFGNTHSGVSR